MSLRKAIEEIAGKYLAPMVAELRGGGLGDFDIACLVMGIGVGFANQKGVDLETIRKSLNELIDASIACGSTQAYVNPVIDAIDNDRKPS